MTLNELKECDENVICIYHEKSRYLFKIYDLLKIINMSLINSQGFFANPLCIKNPYNNLPFNKNILYNIYYFITEKTNLTTRSDYSDLFLKFHSCYFNLTIFLSKYEYLLREHAIINYVKNSTNDILCKDIKNMILYFNENRKNKIYYDKNFPKSKLIEIFSPYLDLYLHSRYSLVPTLKYKSANEFLKKLKLFQEFNPTFGRMKFTYKDKICKDGKVRRLKDGVVFNDKHIKFNVYDNDNFLKDHLSYKNINYDVVNNENHDTEDDDASEEDDDDSNLNTGHIWYSGVIEVNANYSDSDEDDSDDYNEPNYNNHNQDDEEDDYDEWLDNVD
jgi:hypothetical protein